MALAPAGRRGLAVDVVGDGPRLAPSPSRQDGATVGPPREGQVSPHHAVEMAPPAEGDAAMRPPAPVGTGLQDRPLAPFDVLGPVVANETRRPPVPDWRRLGVALLTWYFVWFF